MTKLSDLDLDALRRAVAWGHGFQQRNPQIKVFPDPMPAEGTQAWLELAKHLASNAQSHHLGLKPWQQCPLDVEATGGFATNADEIALCERMRALNISLYEPDPPSAIANATHAQGRRKATRSARVRK
jgi:hypothetical protein